MKRKRICDYSKKRAPVSNDHDETDDYKGIIFPTMASQVASKKNRKVKSLNFQRENSAFGLRSKLVREKKVTRGLGFGFHRERSVSRGLAFSNRTGAREEEIQFDLPKRPRTKRQRQRDGDSDYGALSQSNLKAVFDATSRKQNFLSDGMDLSTIRKARRSPIIFRRSPSLDVKNESFRMTSSPMHLSN
jgi:hypothetical protein